MSVFALQPAPGSSMFWTQRNRRMEGTSIPVSRSLIDRRHGMQCERNTPRSRQDGIADANTSTIWDEQPRLKEPPPVYQREEERVPEPPTYQRTVHLEQERGSNSSRLVETTDPTSITSRINDWFFPPKKSSETHSIASNDRSLTPLTHPNPSPSPSATLDAEDHLHTYTDRTPYQSSTVNLATRGVSKTQSQSKEEEDKESNEWCCGGWWWVGPGPIENDDSKDTPHGTLAGSQNGWIPGIYF